MEFSNGIAIFEDEEQGVVLGFLEKDMKFCEDCPTKDGKDGILKDDNGEEIAIHMVGECPCIELKKRAQISISVKAKQALKEAGMWDDFLEKVKKVS